MDYKGKKVLVTGGASGIGREIALEYARAGAMVIVADKDYEGDRFVRGELRPIMPDCCFFHCDLALSSACENLMQSIFEQFDDLDIIINNAGVSQFCSLWEETVEHWDYVLNSNLRAMFLISREYMINRRKKGYKERYGRIVNISSTRSLMSEEGTEAYTASKGGVTALTHALAVSFAPYAVTVNSISPGWICCDGYDQLGYADHRQHLSGRVGRPEDVASACLFLTDEKNDFINGQDLVVDGGMTKKMIYLD